jgi:hypothetical protein
VEPTDHGSAGVVYVTDDTWERERQTLAARSADGGPCVVTLPPPPPFDGDPSGSEPPPIDWSAQVAHAMAGAKAAATADDPLGAAMQHWEATGTRGVLFVPRLTDGAMSRGALKEEVGAVLRRLAAWAHAGRLRLVVHGVDKDLPVRQRPVPLSQVLASGGRARSERGARAGHDSGGPLQGPAVGGPPREPLESSSEPRWRPWVDQLRASKGRQSFGAFEQLFRDAYLPLLHAAEQGVVNDAGVEVLHGFRDGFAHAYIEMTPAFGATTKRPRMVCDLAALAAPLARLHGTRATHFVMVPCMRFDLGLAVRAEVERMLAGQVALADEWMVWSAYPTTSALQLALFAQGPEALRAPVSRSPTQEDRDNDGLRGRAASILRRVRVGHRDIFRLDVVEASLAEAGSNARSASRTLPRSVATVLARHTGQLSVRTLLVLFGAHGYTLRATGECSFGGATPEEVLNGAFAFVLGPVH